MASAARLKASTARLRGAAVEERKRKVAEASQVKSLMEKDELIDCVGALIEHVSPNGAAVTVRLRCSIWVIALQLCFWVQEETGILFMVSVQLGTR